MELVPSVPKLFDYFHPDAAQVAGVARRAYSGRRRPPLSGAQPCALRRHHHRSPAAGQAAGSSLLYSQEFYAVAKERLQPGGILAQWLPTGDDAVQASVARAVKDSFPYVRVYPSVERWGWHLFASDRPIPERSAAEIVAKMPASAVADMMEWGPAKTPEEQFDLMLSAEMTAEQ